MLAHVVANKLVHDRVRFRHYLRANELVSAIAAAGLHIIEEHARVGGGIVHERLGLRPAQVQAQLLVLVENDPRLGHFQKGNPEPPHV